MRKAYCLRTFILCFVVSTLAGCVGNRIYRKGEQSIEVNPPVKLTIEAHTRTETGDFDLAFVEFDDMGELWEQCDLTEFSSGQGNCQLQRALNLIADKKKQSDVVVITFVHGWNNNASRENEEHDNLLGFENVLYRVSEAEKVAHRAKPKRVIGIYMAWRGKLFKGPLWPFSLFNRRDAAERVTGASFTEAVYRLMYATKSSRPASPDSKFIIVGHSFGGLILERAIMQPFIALLLERRDSQKDGIESTQTVPITFDSPADLIVFINSANDSLETKEMLEMMKRTHMQIRREGAGPEPGSPLFISMTSTGDWATAHLPLVQYVPSLSKAFRDYDPNNKSLEAPTHSQRYYFSHTTAHVDSFISHVLTPKPEIKVEQCQSEDDRVKIKKKCYQFQRRDGAWNDTPYWIMQIPPDMVPDHSRIFGTDLVRFLDRLVTRYVMTPSATKVTMQSR